MINNIVALPDGGFEIAPLKDDEVIIWSKDGCTYCQMAKNLLKEEQYDFQDRNVDDGFWEMEKLMEIAPDTRTMPQIFMDGKHIGGYDDLDAYLYLKGEG